MEKEVRKMIEENPIAFASVDNMGNPHVIAVADVKVISENRILIGDNYMKKTVDNIKSNRDISIAVWENSKGSEAEGYQLDGIAEYFEKGKWREMVKKIHRGCPNKGAIVVEIKNIKKLS